MTLSSPYRQWWNAISLIPIVWPSSTEVLLRWQHCDWLFKYVCTIHICKSKCSWEKVPRKTTLVSWKLTGDETSARKVVFQEEVEIFVIAAVLSVVIWGNLEKHGWWLSKVKILLIHNLVPWFASCGTWPWWAHLLPLPPVESLIVEACNDFHNNWNLHWW